MPVAPLAALRHPAFRLFFAGQFVSILGTWMQTVAVSWLVYRLTGSPLALTVTAAAQQLPMLFLAPLAGVWADRVNRRRLLIAVQSVACVQATALAVLAFTGTAQVWHIVALSLVSGAVNAIETPTRQAFLLEMVGSRDDLPNAIALQSMLFNGARFIGPSIAGATLALAGEGWCFGINAASFLFVVAAYARMRPRPVHRAASGTNWRRQLTEGFRYAFGALASRRLLALLGALSFCSAPWQSLLPIFAGETFGGGSRTLGFLISAVGLGALAATVLLAVRGSPRGLGRVIVAGSLTAGAALAAFSFSHTLWLSLGLLALFGFGLIASVASTNTILQTIAEEDKRGRLISIYVMVFLGIAPFGNFAAGLLAERIGAHWTLLVHGLALTVAAGLFAGGYPRWRVALRAAYARQARPPP